MHHGVLIMLYHVYHRDTPESNWELEATFYQSHTALRYIAANTVDYLNFRVDYDLREEEV